MKLRGEETPRVDHVVDLFNVSEYFASKRCNRASGLADTTSEDCVRRSVAVQLKSYEIEVRTQSVLPARNTFPEASSSLKLTERIQGD
jgi:hypothetical protein